MVPIANNGTLLPFQAIYQRKTTLSCPSKTAPYFNDVICAGMLLEFSGTATYWSNQQMMRNFIKNILAPYFDKEQAKLELPHTQKSLWQIDVWSVHRSEEFRNWMETNFTNIILNYVPGGCTGLHQPCDVGIRAPRSSPVRFFGLFGLEPEPDRFKFSIYLTEPGPRPV